jgi:hypothetical protein
LEIVSFRNPGLTPGATLCPLLRRFIERFLLVESSCDEYDENSKTTLDVSRTKHQFAICVQNEGYLASLELWKVYRMIADLRAAKDQLVRIIDESGEDYLYDQSWFVPIKLPQAAKDAMLAASR